MATRRRTLTRLGCTALSAAVSPPDPKRSTYVHLFNDGGIFIAVGETGGFGLVTEERLIEAVDRVIARGGVLVYTRDDPDKDPSAMALRTFERVVDRKPPLQLQVRPHPMVAERPADLTTLMLVASVSNVPVVRDLIKRGADLERQTSEGMTALMLAANGGHREVAEALVRGGAAVDARGEKDSTAIMFAAQHGHEAIVRALLQAGADPNARGSHGFTPLGFARRHKRRGVARLLESVGGRE